MKATELIKQLTELVSKYGDLPVMDEYNNYVGPFEYTNEAVECFLLVIDIQGDGS